MTRHDLLEMEQRLRASLYKVLPFQAHAIYFPQIDEPLEPVWLPEESRLLLPLRQGDTLLGVFMARELNAERVEALLPELPALASLCLDNLELYKAGRLDTSTGLATRQVLMERVRSEVERIVAPFGGTTGSADEDPRENDGGFALAVIRFPGLENLARQWGYGFAERFLSRLAEVFRESLPDGVLATRAEDAGFGVVFTGYDRGHCAEALTATLHALEGVSLPEPYTQRPVFTRACAGFALYPQDMDGEFANLNDPAPALLHKAGLALEVASLSAPGEAPRLMAYGQILAEGGVIRRTLPLSRMEISLGRAVGAREGQCFSVWSVDYPVQGERAANKPLQPLYKGEIVILEARAAESVAEILHLGDPSWPMQPHDSLVLLPRNAPSSAGLSSSIPGNAETSTADPQRDALTGLYRHSVFLSRLARAREGLPAFALAMLHLATPEGDDPHRMAQVARQCREAFVDKGLGDAVLGGRFATSTLVFFHPEVAVEHLTETYSELCERLAKTFGECGAGIALWPFLGYHPADMLEGCRKALEYAMLLPQPHVGVLDSLALNISADKLHCRGDIFAAMEEYKEALLADADNALAWSSLGVCMVGLGRHEEARTHFHEALRRSPDDPAAAYNLGAACQRLNDLAAAQAYYQQCLALAPGHFYATIRLGQLAERNSDLTAARTYYLAAAAQNPESALPHRHLARIALRDATPHVARECLHLALQRNPRDADSLALLAQLYLAGGEDPELAETLARQSVALRPDNKNAWQTLALALEARGLIKQAHGALAKADLI